MNDSKVDRWNQLFAQVVCFSFLRIVPPSAGWCPTSIVALPGEVFWSPLSPSSPLQELFFLSLSEILLSELCFEKGFDTFKV